MSGSSELNELTSLAGTSPEVTGAPGKPSVVLMTEIPFWEPTVGSHVRIASLAKELDRIAQLTVFSFWTIGSSERQQYADLGLTAPLIAHTSWELQQEQPFEPKLSTWPELAANQQPEWTRAACNFLHSNPPDFAIIEYVDRSYLLDALPSGTRSILDAHDVMIQRAASFRAAGMRASIEFSRETEAQLMSRYSAVLAISYADADLLRDVMSVQNVICAPHAVSPQAPVEIRPTASRLLFIGANSPANVLGLTWFLEQVWPIVCDRFRLHIYGDVCESFTPPDLNIILEGQVPDMAPEYAKADIAINPVFVGGGIKIKTLDAMAFGVPCVTTREGAHGLGGTATEALVIADTRLEFVSALLALADDQSLRRRLAERSRTYIADYHKPSAAFRDLALLLTHS